MEKGLVALLLLCHVGFLVTGSPAKLLGAEKQNEVLEALERTIEEARNIDDGFALAEGEEFEDEVETEEDSKKYVVYTRWGQKSCAGKKSTLVYKGRAGGAHYKHTGSASNYICMPDDPEYYSDGTPSTRSALVYGSEYQTAGSPLAALNDDNVPCAVCLAPRQTVLMLPAKQSCPSQWTREYNGYLMAGRYKHVSPKTFVCVDKDAQAVTGEAGNHNGALFYHTKAGSCNGLECPPYDLTKDLSCVVCTR